MSVQISIRHQVPSKQTVSQTLFSKTLGVWIRQRNIERNSEKLFLACFLARGVEAPRGAADLQTSSQTCPAIFRHLAWVCGSKHILVFIKVTYPIGSLPFRIQKLASAVKLFPGEIFNTTWWLGVSTGCCKNLTQNAQIILITEAGVKGA